MGLLIILLPLLVYLIVALAVKKEEIKHPDDYFAAFRKVGKTEFTSSSIAYGFQVSTIYPFLFWGASAFLFVPFINSIFWGIGILLFYFSFNKISKFIGTGKTLPGLIGETYGNKVRTIAALLTVVGFIGYIVAELWFGSRVLLAIFPTTLWVYFSAFIFIFFVAFYLFKGGQISSIRTDQLQLIFTYFGVFGTFIYLLYLLFKGGMPISGALTWGLIILFVLMSLVLLVRKTKFIMLNNALDKIFNISIITIFISILALSILVVFKNSQQFGLQNFFNLEGFGYAGLFSLILLPLSWQFVDLTNWQRLLSVKAPESSSQINQDIKKGLLNFAIESPFTWVLFIVFGLLITAALPDWTFKDILIDFPKQMISSTIIFEQILGYLFIVSIISIMLSTVDSFFMGISFTYTYDINPKTRKLIEGQNSIDAEVTRQILSKGKYFGSIAVLSALVLFVFFDKNIQGGGDLFINLLLTFYSATLSFFPLVIGMVFLKRRPKVIWALLSMLVGSVAGVALGIYAILRNSDLAWYPVIVSISFSSLIYVLGLIFDSDVFNKHKFWLIPSFSLVVVLFFDAIRFYAIILIIIFTILSSSLYSEQCKEFLKKTWYVFVATLAAFLYGVLRGNGHFWIDFEVASIILTIIYSIFIYIQLYRDEHVQKNAVLKALPFIAVGILFIVISVWANAGNGLALRSNNGFGFSIGGSRDITMGLLLLGTFFYAMANFMLLLGESAYRDMYIKSLQYSDIPVVLTFLLLWVSTFKLKGSGEPQYEAFFGGVVAFQMLYSNIVWSFLDEPIIENLLAKKKE